MSSIPYRELAPFLGGSRGQSFVTTTRTNTTTLSREPKTAIAQRIDATALVDELEFMAGQVPPEVLAEKLRAARNAVRFGPSWDHASYADPRRHWDDTASLEARIDDVQRVFESRYGPLRTW